MMKKIMLIFTAIVVSTVCFAQGQGYPPGADMSLFEIRNRTPSQPLEL